MNRSHLFLSAASLAFASFPAADVIALTDGEILRDVKVTVETLKETTYELNGEPQTVESERILYVSFDELPDLVDEAMTAYDEEDPQGALEMLDEFVSSNVPKMRTRAKWSPAYAAWRSIEIRRELSDAEGVVGTAETLIASFPDSRYVAPAHLAKAEFELRAGDSGAAETTLVALDELARDQGLKRWELASRLARLEAADRSADEMRDAYQNLAASAAKYPTVKARAKVAEAQTYLGEAAKAQLKQANEMRSNAKRLFEQVVSDPKAGPRALAGAHTGMGECLYYEGAATADADILSQAVLHSLRVAVSHRQETDYLPRALFFAFRSFDVMKQRGRKADMLAELEELFAGSPWTAEAQKYR